ncbi:hypothetical protein V5E97_18520 [Singulisphaera sp. Ch08]|uniref:Uncharacterized protein n=1 Tax=Singulisphaera sp. Ch08 TaxID=3120278 RepID=A0AAU7CSJ6_9BACT
MSDLAPPEANSDEPLQFDNAEYATRVPGRLTCTACQNEVENTYYEINGVTVCDACRTQIETQRVGGSSLLRFAKATLFGSLAAFLGFMIYFGVMELLNIEIGLIAILVGFMVGTAVRSGSRHRGGWAYQVLAVSLTYAAISASYLATAIADHIQAAEAEANPGKPMEPTALEGKEKEVEGPQEPPTDRVGNDRLEPQAGEKRIAQDNPQTLMPAILLVSLLIESLKLPILANLSSPIGLLIVGFALWEAWKLNRPVSLVFNGPFSFGGESAPPPSEAPSHA